jgi:putative tryptophan/tyrosine transport system substrate-binding protein
MLDMKRRDFITLLGGAAAAWPLAVRAQQAAMPVIGFLGAGTPSASDWVTAFVQRLRELDWIEGRNIAIEYRWAEGRPDRAAESAAEFVRRKVDVIVVQGTPPAIAAKQATVAIPIVFTAVGDPVGNNLVASLAHPGGNITGLSSQQSDLATKRLELLREVVSQLHRLGIFVNVENPVALLDTRELEQAAHTLGLEVAALDIRRAEDIAPALAAFKGRVDALYTYADLLTITNRALINNLALDERLPTMHGIREFVITGGLMSYGVNLPDLFRRAADFVDKILRGAKPSELPVEQPTKFDLVLNLKTAKALSLTVPDKLLALADEVIE